MAKATSSSEPALSTASTVFIDSNLETHLALIVAAEDTIGDLKCKIRIEHPLCFPNIGEITIHALKVRRKAHLYHLSDSMLVTHAFNGIKGTWFLHMDASSKALVGNQIASRENHLRAEKGTRSCIMDVPSMEENLQDIATFPLPRSKMLSVPNNPSLPQFKSSLVTSQLVPSGDQFGSHGRDREVNLNHTEADIPSDEVFKDSSDNKILDSDVPPKCDPITEENGGSGAHVELEKNMIDQMENDVRDKDPIQVSEIRETRDLQFDNISGEMLQPKPGLKKKRKKEKEREDDLKDLIEGHLKVNGAEARVSCKVAPELEHILPEIPSVSHLITEENGSSGAHVELEKNMIDQMEKAVGDKDPIQVSEILETRDLQFDKESGEMLQPKPGLKKKRKKEKEREDDFKDPVEDHLKANGSEACVSCKVAPELEHIVTEIPSESHPITEENGGSGTHVELEKNTSDQREKVVRDKDPIQVSEIRESRDLQFDNISGEMLQPKPGLKQKRKKEKQKEDAFKDPVEDHLKVNDAEARIFSNELESTLAEIPSESKHKRKIAAIEELPSKPVNRSPEKQVIERKKKKRSSNLSDRVDSTLPSKSSDGSTSCGMGNLNPEVRSSEPNGAFRKSEDSNEESGNHRKDLGKDITAVISPEVVAPNFNSRSTPVFLEEKHCSLAKEAGDPNARATIGSVLVDASVRIEMVETGGGIVESKRGDSELPRESRERKLLKSKKHCGTSAKKGTQPLVKEHENGNIVKTGVDHTIESEKVNGEPKIMASEGTILEKVSLDPVKAETNSKDGVDSLKLLKASGVLEVQGGRNESRKKSKKSRYADAKSPAAGSPKSGSRSLIKEIIETEKVANASSYNGEPMFLASEATKLKNKPMGLEEAEMNGRDVLDSLNLPEDPGVVEGGDGRSRKKKKSKKIGFADVKSNASSTFEEALYRSHHSPETENPHNNLSEIDLTKPSKIETLTSEQPRLVEETNKSGFSEVNSIQVAQISRAEDAMICGDDKVRKKSKKTEVNAVQMAQISRTEEPMICGDEKVKRKSKKTHTRTAKSLLEPLMDQVKAGESEVKCLPVAHPSRAEETADYREEKVKKELKTTHVPTATSPLEPSIEQHAASRDEPDAHDSNTLKIRQTDEKKNKENKLSRKRKKMRAEKPGSKNQVSEIVLGLENGTNSRTQSSDIHHISETLECDAAERASKADVRDDDTINFIKFFVPKVGQLESVDPAQEIEAKEAQKFPKEKTSKKTRKLNMNSEGGSLPDLESRPSSKDKKLRDSNSGSVQVKGLLSQDDPRKRAHLSNENTSFKENYAIQAASSASTKSSEDRPSLLNCYGRAITKASSKKLGEVLNNSKREKSLLATKEAIFKDMSNDGSDDEGEVNNSEATDGSLSDNSSSSAYSGGEYEEIQSMMMAPENWGNSDSRKNGGKNKENGGNDILQSPLSTMRNMTLDMILRNSNSYRKAKLTASQSQLEDSESQPIDFVLDSQVHLTIP